MPVLQRLGNVVYAGGSRRCADEQSQFVRKCGEHHAPGKQSRPQRFGMRTHKVLGALLPVRPHRVSKVEPSDSLRQGSNSNLKPARYCETISSEVSHRTRFRMRWLIEDPRVAFKNCRSSATRRRRNHWLRPRRPKTSSTNSKITRSGILSLS